MDKEYKINNRYNTPRHGLLLSRSHDSPLSHNTKMDRTNQWSINKINPHIAQFFRGPERQLFPTINKQASLQFTRTLTNDALSRPYRRRKGKLKSVVHWGQRKLLMSEIEFLSRYAHPENTVVYAGAAPGTHIGFLADLFSTLSFVLVDPAPFLVPPSDRIQIRTGDKHGMFTDEIAREFAGRNDILFISDIRTANWSKLSSQETEEYVKSDQTAQMRWHQIMNPRKSMLKFRLPWEHGKTEYLDGEIFLPVWGPQTTTETRLVPTHGIKMWDNKHYEGQMFHFNTVTRVTAYPHKVCAKGLDHCYDCAAEIEILRAYIERYHSEYLNSTQGALHPLDFIERNRQVRDSTLDASAGILPLRSHSTRQFVTHGESGDSSVSRTLDLESATHSKQSSTYNSSETHERDETDVSACTSRPFPTACSANEPQLSRLLQIIGEMSEYINHQCSMSSRTLETVMPPPEKRRRFQGRF